MKHLVLFIMLGTVLSGCQKLIDLYQRHESEQPGESKCHLDSIYPGSVKKFDVAAGVHYNEKGNPVIVNYTYYDDFETQFPVAYEYDEQDRLIRIIPENIYLGPKDVDYVYEGNSRVPKTARTWGLYIIEDDEFFYDEANRLIRVLRKTKARLEGDPSVYPDTEYKFSYDASGNRQEDPANESYSGPVEYTDKPSLYSLNPVWQIVHWDYSKNSVVSVEKYNENDLPLQYKTGPTYYFQPFLLVGAGSGYKFSYTCKE